MQTLHEEKPSSCEEFRTIFPTQNILKVPMLKEEYIAKEEEFNKEEDFVTNEKYVKSMFISP